MKSLLSPANISSLVLFRILFGLYFVLQFFVVCDQQYIIEMYVEPQVFLSFPLFKILHLPILSDKGFYFLIQGLGVASFLVMVGAFFYPALLFLFIGQLYLGLLEYSYFLNATYLYLLVTFLMFFTRANAAYSVDVMLFPKIRRKQIPYIYLFTLQFQFAIVFIFSALSKLFYVDWLQGKQMLIWLSALGERYRLFEGLFTNRFFASTLSISAIVFELTFVVLIYKKKTRVLAICLLLMFNAFNKWMLGLDFFPLFIMFCSVLFIDPERIQNLFSSCSFRNRNEVLKFSDNIVSKPNNMITGFLVIYLFIQLIVPLRSYFYNGNVSWNRKGINFSWRMMNDNFKSSMKVYFTPPEDLNCIFPSSFNATQRWMVAADPYAIRQYVKYFGDQLKMCGVKNPEIYIESFVNLNRRGMFPLVDPRVNIYNNLLSDDWILPHPDIQGEPYQITVPDRNLKNFHL